MSSPAPEVTPGLAAVRSWCGWHIAPSVTESIKVEGEGGRVLLLPSLHVTDVTAIRNESGDETSGWKWRENGIVRGCWTCDELYEVDLTHGYTNMPAELVNIIDQIDGEGVGARIATSQSTGPFAESFASSVDLEAQPLSVRSVLARYRLPSRP